MTKKLQYVVDSSILISYLRGEPRAKQLLSQIDSIYISVLSATELLVGAITPTHKAAVEKLLEEIDVIDINLPIARLAGQLISKHADFFGKKVLHGVIDAFIVATGEYLGIPILTLNVRHFSKFKSKKTLIIAFNSKRKTWRV